MVVQRINSFRITKHKDESISECMRRIYGAYLSAELDKAPLETLALLHLLILLPSDPLSEKIKAWLVEKMRLNPNIDNLNEVGAYILSQESNNIARKITQDKANKSVKRNMQGLSVPTSVNTAREKGLGIELRTAGRSFQRKLQVMLLLLKRRYCV